MINPFLCLKSASKKFVSDPDYFGIFCYRRGGPKTPKTAQTAMGAQRAPSPPLELEGGACSAPNF